MVLPGAYPSSCTDRHFYCQFLRLPVFQQPCQHLVFLVFLRLDIVVGNVLHHYINLYFLLVSLNLTTHGACTSVSLSLSHPLSLYPLELNGR